MTLSFLRTKHEGKQTYKSAEHLISAGKIIIKMKNKFGITEDAIESFRKFEKLHEENKENIRKRNLAISYAKAKAMAMGKLWFLCDRKEFMLEEIEIVLLPFLGIELYNHNISILTDKIKYHIEDADKKCEDIYINADTGITLSGSDEDYIKMVRENVNEKLKEIKSKQ